MNERERKTIRYTLCSQRTETAEGRRKALKLQRRRKMQVRWLTAAAVLFLAAGFLSILSAASTVQADDAEQLYKYYTDVRVEHGDTLYSIAESNISRGYDSIDDYLKEIRPINSVYTDDIYYGQTLVVPYYSEELK